MSDVAEAVGAGVASVYRLYPSKYELYAALVVRRMDQIVDAARAAESLPGDRWTGLTQMLRDLVAEQSVEPFVGEARALVADHPDVIASTARAADAQERVLAAARAEGRLRGDASSLDLRLLFAATRAAKRTGARALAADAGADARRARHPARRLTAAGVQPGQTMASNRGSTMRIRNRWSTPR